MADGSVTIDTSLNNKGFKQGLSTLGSMAKTGLKAVTVATGAVAAGFTAIVTASVKARGEIEQSIGGVETLFKENADKVIENANNAYKTAGMSANEYMQNVTSFSASLLQSVAGDTSKAADIADMAMIDMSDNANKMGTSMEAITVAYQGFAKQNYTMLDNLKLGYGGTKKEMERLLKDAQKITGIKYNINNLSDVYEAIHVIQGELGITGTTALEAEKTLTGSISALKASWNNFLSGSGNLGQVTKNIGIVAENILRIVNDAMSDIMDNLVKWLPEMLKLGADLIKKIVDGIIKNLPTLMKEAGEIISSLIQGILDLLPELIPIAEQVLQTLIEGLVSFLPQLIESAGAIIDVLVRGILNTLPLLIPATLQIIQTIFTGLIKYLPQIIQVGIQVISKLISGIAQMLPTLIPQAVECILTIVEGLLDNIDMLVDAAIELIMGLADGLIEALPILIEKAPVIIVKLVDAILRNLPKLLEAGVKLIFKLAEGLIKAVPQLLSKIPQIVSGIVKSFGNYVSSFWEIGKNIVKGIWNGIRNVKDWLFEKIKGFKDAVLNKFKSFFGIHSPSTLFEDEIGKYLALGIGEGFNDSIGAVYKKMRSAVDFETQKLSANLSTTANVNKMLTAYIEVNGDVNMDGNKVGRMVAPVVARNFRTAGA